MEPDFGRLFYVRQRYPELEIRSVRALDMYRKEHRVFAVNETVVFRFPKNADDVQALMLEKAILSRIHATLPLPVPHPLYSSSGTHKPGEVFVGYHYIQGVPLTPEKLGAVEDIRLRRRLAKQLGDFLCTLHAYPPEYIGVPLPLGERRADWEGTYREAREKLFPQLNAEAQRRFGALFEEFLGDAALQDYKACLRHGKIVPYNILFNHESQIVSGVVDFRRAGVGDPAIDLAGLLAYGEEFLDWASLMYRFSRETQRRAVFIHAVEPLRQALRGLCRGDAEAATRALQPYR